MACFTHPHCILQCLSPLPSPKCEHWEACFVLEAVASWCLHYREWDTPAFVTGGFRSLLGICQEAAAVVSQQGKMEGVSVLRATARHRQPWGGAAKASFPCSLLHSQAVQGCAEQQMIKRLLCMPCSFPCPSRADWLPWAIQPPLIIWRVLPSFPWPSLCSSLPSLECLLVARIIFPPTRTLPFLAPEAGKWGKKNPPKPFMLPWFVLCAKKVTFGMVMVA